MALADEQTGSIWHAVKGSCIEGRLKGAQLRVLDTRLAFWFAWAKFHGDTEWCSDESGFPIASPMRLDV